MSDDDDWTISDPPKKEDLPPEPPKEESRRGRGRGGEGKVQADGPAQQKEQNKTEEEKKGDEKAEDSWVSEQKDKVQPSLPQDSRDKSQNLSRGKDIAGSGNSMNVSIEESISEVINPKATELQIQKNESSWLEESNTNKEVEQNQGRGRGRGNRGNNGEGEGFQGKNPQFEGNEANQNRGRGNRGNRGGDRDYNREGGFQNRPRGGNFGDNGGYRRNREDGEGGGFRGNRGGGENGGFRGNRGGENGQGGGYRGNRGGENGGFQGNRAENGDFRRNRQEGGGFNRNNNRDRDNQGWRNDRGQRPERRGEGFNRNDRDGRNQHQNQNRQNAEIKKEIQKVVKLPGGKAWPTCELLIMGSKMSVTLRRLQEFNAKVLIVPYSSLMLEYDPGNYVIKSQVDYRGKLKAKGDDIAKPGRVYFQKAVELDNFKALAFLKVDNTDESSLKTSLEAGIEAIMRDLRVIQQQDQKLDTLVFPLCQKLCDPSIVISAFASNMVTYTQIKEVSLCAKDPKFFLKCIEGYQKSISDMIDNNEISYE